MRLVKDVHELATMRRAARISAAAHERAMRATKPGRAECEVEAELLHEFRRGGASSPAYTSIVAGGANACVLHYVQNDAVLNAGDLLLIDAGCESGRLRFGHHADVSGRRHLQPGAARYLRARARCAGGRNRRGCAGCVLERPPRCRSAPCWRRGAVEFGLCQGSVDKVIESGDYKKFYMHRTGHWLRLDVHDAGDYKQAGDWRKQARMVPLSNQAAISGPATACSALCQHRGTYRG